MGRETHAEFTCENAMFFQLGISCKLGKRKNGTGGRQEIFIREKEMFCAVWNKISSMQSDVSTTEFGDQRMSKHQ